MIALKASYHQSRSHRFSNCAWTCKRGFWHIQLLKVLSYSLWLSVPARVPLRICQAFWPVLAEFEAMFNKRLLPHSSRRLRARRTKAGHSWSVNALAFELVAKSQTLLPPPDAFSPNSAANSSHLTHSHSIKYDSLSNDTFLGLALQNFHFQGYHISSTCLNIWHCNCVCVSLTWHCQLKFPVASLWRSRKIQRITVRSHSFSHDSCPTVRNFTVCRW
jgi:hypothetical protein